MKGRRIKLKEGNTVVQEKTIETADINLQDVPNGVYTVEISGEKWIECIISVRIMPM